MTADIRTAAQREAEARWPRRDISLLHDADMENHLIRSGFTDGAVWGAARVTPTRLQIAKVLAGGDRRFWEYPNNDYDRERYLAEADKLLVLLAGLAEGAS